MFRFRHQPETSQFILLLPLGHEPAWVLLSQEELQIRADQNQLPEGSRVFRLGEEIRVRIEKTTLLEEE